MTEPWFIWPLVAASVLGTLAVARMRRWGWLMWVISNVGWLLYTAAQGRWPQAALWSVYLATAVYGLLQWRRQPSGSPGRLLADEPRRMAGGNEVSR